MDFMVSVDVYVEKAAVVVAAAAAVVLGWHGTRRRSRLRCSQCGKVDSENSSTTPSIDERHFEKLLGTQTAFSASW